MTAAILRRAKCPHGQRTATEHGTFVGGGIHDSDARVRMETAAQAWFHHRLRSTRYGSLLSEAMVSKQNQDGGSAPVLPGATRCHPQRHCCPGAASAGIGSLDAAC